MSASSQNGHQVLSPREKIKNDLPLPDSRATTLLSVLFIPLLVLVVGLSITWLTWDVAQKQVENEFQDYFDFRVRQAFSLTEQRMLAQEQVLRGVQGLFVSSKSVERDEFRNYVASLHLEENYPGIQGVGFSLIVPPAEKERHVAAIRRESGYPEYYIRPEGVRDLYTSIIYLEPFSGRNLRAFGFDMYSEPVRRAAMEQARDSGRVSLSGKVKLVQENDKNVQAGFLMYLPVYRNGAPQGTVQERRANIVGWAYSPLRMDDFVLGMFGERAADLDIEIYDGETISSDALMYDSASDDQHGQGKYHLSSTQHLNVTNHVWTLVFHSLPGLESQLDHSKPILLAYAGAGSSLLLATLAWLLVNGRRRALAYAHELNRNLIENESALRESEELFRNYFSLGQIGMAITSLDQKWLHVNDRLCEMLGFSKEELVKMTWVELTHPDDLAMDLVQFNRLISNEIERYSLDKRFIHKSGKIVYTHLTVSCKRKHDHTIDYAIASLEDITERKHLQESLTIREKELTEAQTIAKLGSWHVTFGADASQDIWTISKELRKLYEYTDDKEIDFNTGIVAMPPEDQEFSQRCWAEAKRGAGPMEWDHRIIVNGEIRWMHVSARFTFDANGNALEASGTNQDITVRKKTEEIIARNEINLRAILDNIPYLVWLKDKDSRFVAVNQAFFRTTGKSGMDEVIGKTDFDLWPRDLAQKYRNDDLDVMDKRMQKLTEEQSLDKGVSSWVETFKAPILDHDGNVLGTTGFARDITERKRTQDMVQRMAHYDALTDLPNRALFSDRLQQALVAAKRDKSHMALMFIDLDKFKPINDELGHHIGDMLLKEAARRMQDCVRESDTVGRIGGDEFVVLLPVIEEEKDALLVAEKIRVALNNPFVLAGQSLGISSSSGIAVYPEHGKDEPQLMKNADAAMYHAKQNGRNNVVLYQTDMQSDG